MSPPGRSEALIAERATPAALDPRRVAVFVVAAVLLTAWRLAVVPHLGFTLFYDEAQYWDWSRELAWGYYSKPPMIAALIALGTALFGSSELGVKLVPMLLYPLTAGVVGLLAHEIRRGAGLVAALIFLTLPMTGILGLFASTDAPLLLCWAVAAWALWRAQSSDALRWWALVGVATGLGLLSKYTMAAFALSALPALWLVPGPRRGLLRAGPWLAALIAALLLAPNIAWNAAHGFPTLQHTAEITTGAARAGGPQEAVSFLVGQALLLGPLVALWAVVGLLARGGRRTPAAAYLAALTLPLIALACVQAWHAHAHLNWAAPAHVGAVVAAALALSAPQPRRVAAAAAIALNLLLTALLVHSGHIGPALTGQPLPSKLDVFARMRGWDRAFAAVRAQIDAREPSLLARATVLAQERLVLTQAAYQWRDLGIRPVAWNPTGAVHDHYGLATRFAPSAGQPVVLLAIAPDGDGIPERFAHVEPLASVRIESAPGRFISLHAWRLANVAGYPPIR